MDLSKIVKETKAKEVEDTIDYKEDVDRILIAK